ncbi:hypothetical protein NIES2100_63340 [Calothrix sp. NIES-2100]|uniref:hypothetical protein n=1 Tax=Calothrix sp. NIES-2100 TaxID=1954172 RepID=UPI000B604F64|nr:hypothetical protein NIES2100_63340 [Calothrix sp. NIES-2100]
MKTSTYFIASMAGLIVLLSGLPGFSGSDLVAKQSNTTPESPSRISEVFEKLESGMTYEQVVSKLGKPGQNIPLDGFVARWSRKNNTEQVTLIIEGGKINTREILGNWGLEVEQAKTYAEMLKLLGEPIGKREIYTYIWQDDRGCQMNAKFVKNQAIEVQYMCIDGKFGFIHSALGNIELQPLPSIPKKGVAK